MKPFSKRSALLMIFLSWLSMVGFDFLLHAGILARQYLARTPFLLPPELAFRRVPIGYLSFLLMAWILWWLTGITGTRGGGPGFRLGLWFGAATWGAFLLGMYSISTAPWPLLLGWWLGQALELGIGGWVIGKAQSGMPAGRLAQRVILFFIFMVAITIILQSTGLVPAMKQ